MALTKKSKYKPVYLEYHKIDYHTKRSCEICGKEMWITHLTIHHLIPLRVAPERAMDLSNMTLICHECHNKIHPENEYMKDIVTLRKERKWFKQRIEQYIQQIDEMKRTVPGRYFQRYLECNKRLQRMLDILRKQSPEVSFPEEWSADKRTEI